MNRNVLHRLVLGLSIFVLLTMISIPTVSSISGMLLTGGLSPNSNNDPQYQPHWDGGKCVSGGGGGIPVVLDQSQCADAGPNCVNGIQTLILDREKVKGLVINQDPCTKIIVTNDDEEDEGKDEDEDEDEDEEDNDDGVQNKLDNINDDTNDEDAPIRQPDNVDNDNDDNAITQQPQQFSTPQGSGGDGLSEACLQSGFSPQQCNSYLFSKNPGGACSTAAAGGANNCPVQDPAETFSNPGQAAAESTRKALRAQGLGQQFQGLFPPGELGSTFLK